MRLCWFVGLGLGACLPATPLDEPEVAGPAQEEHEQEEHEQGEVRAVAGRAAAVLATLVVRAPGAKTGYGREAFGTPWADVDHNGCDTRDDILRRDLGDVRLEPGARACVVLAGVLADPYTGREIRFERGGGSEVDVDHVVALGNAWASGAARWPLERRVALANDPLNLLAVEASANRRKQDRDTAHWLPPNPAYHCAYVARQVAVKAKYRLAVTADEREAMATVLRACPEEPLPDGETRIVARREASRSKPVDDGPRRTRSAPAAEARATVKRGGVDPDYGSCKQAKASGAGPYVRGRDPEYAYYRDGDGDGVVCE